MYSYISKNISLYTFLFVFKIVESFRSVSLSGKINETMTLITTIMLSPWSCVMKILYQQDLRIHELNSGQKL